MLVYLKKTWWSGTDGRFRKSHSKAAPTFVPDELVDRLPSSAEIIEGPKQLEFELEPEGEEEDVGPAEFTPEEEAIAHDIERQASDQLAAQMNIQNQLQKEAEETRAVQKAAADEEKLKPRRGRPVGSKNRKK